MKDLKDVLARLRSQPQSRSALLTRAADAADGQPTFTMSLSSEAEIERWGFIEVLSHEAGAVDLSRAMNGLPLLTDHDWRNLVGRANNIHIRGDRVLEATVVFSRSAAGAEVQQDVVDGIRTDVSIGYEILDAEQTGVRDGTPIVTVTRWRPYETSMVSVAADISIGVGRGATVGGGYSPSHASDGDANQSLNSRGSEDMSAKAKTQSEEGATETGERQAPVEVRDRSDLAAIGRLTREHNMTDLLPDFLERGLSLSDARAEMLSRIAERAKTANAGVVPSSGAGQLGLSEKETRRYNFFAAAEAAYTGDDTRAGYEMELSDAVSKTLQGRSPRGFYVPGDVLLAGVRDIARRRISERALGGNFAAGTATDGPEFKIAEAGTYIDFLYNAARVVEAGAQVLPGLDREQAMPRMTGPLVGSWTPELPGSDNGSADPSFDQEKLTPRAINSPVVEVSRQLLTSTAPFSMQAIVINAIARSIGLGIDAGALTGTGLNGQPTGVYARPGVDGGAIATFDWAAIVALKTAVAAANADLTGASYLLTPELAGLAETTRKDAGSGIMLLENGRMAGFPALPTNQMPKNLAGTGNDAHGIVFGNFAYMLIALFGAGVEIIIDPYAKKRRNIVEIMGVQLADVGFSQPGGFKAKRFDMTP